ncbi:MAG: 16S rRNA (cytosine(1402)-N(4))-methyltransferase RsmH [Hyphomicrobium sp.]
MTAASGSPDIARHIPVMLPDVLDALQPKPRETYIDGTFGAGGYTRAILETADCRVVAFDRDPTAIAAGAALVEAFAPRLTLLHRPFGEMAEAIQEIGVEAVDGVVLDIGVSSMQIDQAERGFSFQSDGPLDMRMSCEGPSAADVVNGFEEEQIADIIYEYGEERRSRAIARAIVKARAIAPLTRTKDLADLVLRVFHGRKEDGRHPATRTFQGLRIFVNDELGELERALGAAEKILRPGGRLVLVTFHSLEDRIVKRFLAERSGKMDQGSRYLPQKNIQVSPPSFRLVNSRPLTPQKGELDVNPRARSARLRAAIRTDAPAWSAAPGSR